MSKEGEKKKDKVERGKETGKPKKMRKVKYIPKQEETGRGHKEDKDVKRVF